jgi:hypothetical protein
MKYTYEVDEKNQIVIRSDGAWIPMVEGNADYQRYLNRDKPEAEHFTPIVTDAD